MEKVIQEFRIIETDDGFRIEIKGDKDQLREWVMHLDPRNWMHRPPRFGPWDGPWNWKGGRGKGRHEMRFGPFGGWFRFGGPWGWDEDEEDDRPRGKRRHHRHHEHGHHEHAHGHHHGADEPDPDTV